MFYRSMRRRDIMRKIAVIIDDMFEDVEYQKPAKALIERNCRLEHVGLKEGKVVYGKKDRTPVTVDKQVKYAKVGDYDALLIPGGYSPDRLRADEKAVSFVREFVNSGKPIFMICHAAQLLITADVIKGRKVTGYKSIRQDIKNAGAEFADKEVVEDGNLISSRNPGDLPAFIESIIKKLEE